MAPSRRKTTTETNPTRRIMTRSIYKKQQQTTMSSSEAAKSNSIEKNPKDKSNEEGKSSTNCNDICSTPKGKKYMIPKISTCPPAPKKKRLVLNCLSVSSSSSSAKFFAHSDLEMFFLFAPRNIHA